MFKLRPNNRGIIQPKKETIRHAGQVVPYKKKNPSLYKIDKLMKGSKPKICISRKQGGIGDVLMTTPTVKSIASKYGTQVDYATDFEYLEGALPKVLKYNTDIRKIIPWQNIDYDEYDAVLDLTCPCIAYEKPGAKPVNRIDLFAQHLGIKLITTELDYYVTEEEEEWAVDHIEKNNLQYRDLILVQPFASAITRSVPVDRLKKALASIVALNPKVTPIIITHGSDAKKENWAFDNVHVLHNYDIRDIAAIMTQCKLTICPDSSILHVAAALHHPTLTIFGPTDPRARINYHPEAVAYWPAQELKNYPIWYAPSKDGYLCWKIIQEHVIVNTTLAMLNNCLLPNSRNLLSFGSCDIEGQNYEIL